MKLTGRCVEKVVEDTWLLATEDGAILMKTDQELKVGSTMTFVKPKEVEKYKLLKTKRKNHLAS